MSINIHTIILSTQLDFLIDTHINMECSKVKLEIITFPRNCLDLEYIKTSIFGSKRFKHGHNC